MNERQSLPANCKELPVIGNRSLHWKGGIARQAFRFLVVFWIAFHHNFPGANSNWLAASDDVRPNILWITSEDNGPELGCYGDSYAQTPHLDRLAQQGMLYRNCWSNAPVCAPARTTIITGMWPPSLGAMHMRSEVALPSHVRLFPAYLRELGYYCSNNEKEDYNVEKPEGTWDDSSRTAHWRNRRPGQPFFSVFNITVSHESQIRKRPHEAVHHASKAPVPPYHPSTDEIRQDWAQYYDKVTEMDREVGRILGELESDGLRSETIVVYFGDHGSGMPRSKRWLYQSGLHVPCIVSVPKKWQPLAGDNYREGQATDRLISFLDLAPTMLSLAGTPMPEHLVGSAILGPKASSPPEYLYGFRDRMDERYDFSRAIRDRRYLYICNWMPHRIQGQYLDYMFQTPATRSWLEVYQRGAANEAQEKFWQVKASEELYDLENDPHQLRNLCHEEPFRHELVRMRRALMDWMVQVRDLGWMPESEMISRCRGVQTDGSLCPWELARGDQNYPIERVAEVASWAIQLPVEDPVELTTRILEESSDRDIDRWLSDTEALVRYWAVTGLLVRSVRGVAVNLSGLDSIAKGDPSGAVRVVAAEVLMRFGSGEQSQRAEELLIELANCESTDYWVAMAAMNSLDHSPRSLGRLLEKIEGLPEKEDRLPSRYSPFLRDLKRRLVDPERWMEGNPTQKQ